MERCTGIFFKREKIVNPKIKPRIQIKMPQRSSLWPSMAPPRKRTEVRSGSLRFASPPASLSGRPMAPAAAPSARAPAAANFADPCKTAELQVDQAFCSQVRMNASSRIKVADEKRAGAGLPALLHTNHGRTSACIRLFCGSISLAAGVLFQYGKGTLHADARRAR